MTSKNKLIDKLLHAPLKFNENDFKAFINLYKKGDKLKVDKAFKDLRYCIRKVYDINESRLLETSNANEGLMGKFNKKSTKKRKKKYIKRVQRQKKGERYIKIYSEGDSWFQFPVCVRDITDWLIKKNKDFLLYSDAYAGDWITNIIYEGQYVEGLSKYDPDVFLISGGGNDMVGAHRLAIMVNGKGNQTKKYSSATDLEEFNLEDEIRDKILSAQQYITKEFYSFLWIIKIQYYILFTELYSGKSKFSDLITITQGYAYPFPHKGIRFSLRYPLRPLINWFAGTGKWLYQPLMIKGILDKKLQEAILTALIFDFNNAMIQVVNDFDNVYHIDNRDIGRDKKEWYDELHLKSHVYEEVAEKYVDLIREKIK